MVETYKYFDIIIKLRVSFGFIGDETVETDLSSSHSRLGSSFQFSALLSCGNLHYHKLVLSCRSENQTCFVLFL